MAISIRTAGACALVLSLAAPAALAAGDDKGFGALDAKVREACACAVEQPSGMDAAIQCSRFTREYARASVDYRERWDDADRAVEANLRRLLEHCLIEAKGYVQSLDELDLLGPGVVPGIPPPRPTTVWYRVAVAELAGFVGLLSHIRTLDGGALKGLLTGVSETALTVRLAERDGGGERQIPVASVNQVRVLKLPAW